MGSSSAGTAIMLAIAAGLWFLYLVPTWIRRREYLATERTATRLQQTMRVLAETAEIPESVRLAATARNAARAERLLRAQQRRSDASITRQVRAERVSISAGIPRPRPLPVGLSDAVRRQRLRRTRLMASLLMVGATVLGFVQIGLIATTGAVLGSWLVLGVAAALGGLAIATQRRLDARAMPRASTFRRVMSARLHDLHEPPERRPVEPWTPVAIPRPLYVSKPPVQSLAPSIDAGTLHRQAAERAEEVERAARPAAAVVPLRAEPRAADPRRANRYAGMGIIDPADTAITDLDEVLRRRRAVG